MVLRASPIAQPCVFGPDRGVIQSGGHRVRGLDVPVLVLQEVAPRALQDTWTSTREPRRVTPRHDAVAARFNADQPHLGVVDERIEHADRVAAAPDAGHDGRRQTAWVRTELLPGLGPDHRLELANHQRVWMRAQHGTEQVVQNRSRS